MPVGAAPALAPEDGLLGFALRQVRIHGCWGSRQSAATTSYHLPERTCPDQNLIYLTAGRARWTLAGVGHVLEAGDLLLVPRGVAHHGESLGSAMRLVSLHAHIELPGGRDLLPLLGPPPWRRVAPATELAQLLAGADRALARPPALHATIVPLWTALVVQEWLREDAAQGLLVPPRADGVVGAMLAYLEAHLDAPLRLATLARAAGFSPQHLTRCFRRTLGTSPMACLTDLRLTQAARLLQEGQRTVQAVALAVGISDAGYFTRRFRARFGCTPTAYRDRAGAENPSAGAAAPSGGGRRR